MTTPTVSQSVLVFTEAGSELTQTEYNMSLLDQPVVEQLTSYMTNTTDFVETSVDNNIINKVSDTELSITDTILNDGMSALSTTIKESI